MELESRFRVPSRAVIANAATFAQAAVNASTLMAATAALFYSYHINGDKDDSVFIILRALALVVPYWMIGNCAVMDVARNHHNATIWMTELKKLNYEAASEYCQGIVGKFMTIFYACVSVIAVSVVMFSLVWMLKIQAVMNYFDQFVPKETIAFGVDVFSAVLLGTGVIAAFTMREVGRRKFVPAD